MKTILCFGDSNTFGTNPSGGRWPREIRWPGRLSALLGNAYYVVEEGCGGRTTTFEDPLEPHRNGRTALPISLASHRPIDLVIVSLGTNDLKSLFCALPEDIAYGAGQLVRMVQNYPYGPDYPVPQILLVSPILLGKNVSTSIYTGFGLEAVEKSCRLAHFYERQAMQLGCAFLNAALVAGPSKIDQLHMDAKDHAALADALAQRIFVLMQSGLDT